ncbi:Pcp Pyrrolidone-carboxylate peptidase N-terminal pyroglutamyl peptidase [Pyrenophora tritici-repentis]|nr:peptidase C15 pyroglutamyl peptidase I-like protein [Pyrenophora tritici-repentis]KAI1541983.1 Pcp Pyrrolidone-carboxylate peptidase N-terminal pyroglutamyl peptidase [Pyrenophora tritici-repentis]KAI1542934.1 Pcp Pyrrolidone-carboxylate peptidase N-terminal pyroglutamyl peptidase [Pyrenophora tritici-repentis]KAI1555246.1 Pcp Pyrrolidone-carboxylate peptidase N-terminal pyroglutamyl peptidase [Pyrenophora tritici-repentis]KAI1573237.1 Pcp Pyrrolidone-carboxylate peptidase N-terminal pyroglu
MAPQAYAAIQPPSEEGEKPVTVLVTGFGPFLSKYPQNSSWTIASTLPALIPASPQNPTPIHIHTHHTPIRVSYNTVLDLIPTLLPPGNPMYPAPDIILHIGLAAGRSYYAIESTARGRGYGQIADVDGKRFTDGKADERFPGSRYPPTLETGFGIGDVLGKWKGFLDGAKKDEKEKKEASPDSGALS